MVAKKPAVGEARIPLEEWLRMRDTDQKAIESIERTKKILHQVQVLLSFMLSGKNEEVGKGLSKAIHDFNTQSDLAVFKIEDGRVYIELLPAE